MPKIHSQDEPIRPDPSKRSLDDDSDATFLLEPDDPARAENRGALETTPGDENENQTDRETRSEYSSG